MKVRHIFYPLVFTLLCGCLDSDFDSNDLIVDNKINYLHTSLDINDFPNDPYKILGIMSSDDFFNIIVEYTGGCEEHRFYTWWDGQWSGDSVRSGTFHLLHENRGDACERAVRDTIKLDLNLVFNGRYPVEPAFITVKNAYNKKAITVDPFLAQALQNQGCQLEASLETMLCLQGIWGNNGFLLADSISGHEKVWIQPVKNSYDISLDPPLSGEYHLNITPLFGFELHARDPNCQGIPEGTILPAAVNCMQKR